MTATHAREEHSTPSLPSRLPSMKCPSPSVLAVAGVLALQACSPNEPPEHYGFVARLGRDTVSVENVSRQGRRLTIDGVDRFPRVRRRHTEVQLGPDGGVRRLTMDIQTPSEPENQRDRHVEAEVTADSVHITKRDGSGTVRRDFGARGAIVMAHVPQMYSLYDLYFAAARQHVPAPRADTVAMRQFYIDRQFDRFSMHNATVRLLANGNAQIWHDWLAGVGQATLDAKGHLLTYSGERTTYLVDVTRTNGADDVQAIGARFAALETKGGGAKELSVRDTVVATIGPATITIDYGRPLMRGRVLLGNVVPYDRVWRTGANAATQLATLAPITLAGMAMPAGKYTLWTIPRNDGRVDLIVNTQTGQWGRGYNEKLNLGTASLKVDTLPTPVEAFTIAVVPNGDRQGALTMAWGTFRWTAPIVVQPARLTSPPRPVAAAHRPSPGPSRPPPAVRPRTRN